MEEILLFLKDLEANNNKEWFAQNKDRYQKTKEQFLHFTEILIHEIRSFDPQIPYMKPNECMFRIFRDVRFSNDKRPYKTNYGSYIARGGRKGGHPGYYFHIEPGACFLSGGIYMPQPETLKSIRNYIFRNSSDLLEIMEDASFRGKFELYSDDKLKTAPKGFPKDFVHIDLLRYRSLAPMMRFDESRLLQSDILDFAVDQYRILAPFNQFLYDAIDSGSMNSVEL
ncbi:MAG TPA: DUF2461 domain-containing protein [Prolixibacteraceae bacterium]|nr:DUF2461 domain-containing protein [Prolixibacteraceae bacterium]